MVSTVLSAAIKSQCSSVLPLLHHVCLGLRVRKFLEISSGKCPEIYSYFSENFQKISHQYKSSKWMCICLHLHFLLAFTASLCTNSYTKSLFSWLIVLIGVACMVSFKSTLVLRSSVIFTIRENFRKFSLPFWIIHHTDWFKPNNSLSLTAE